MKFAFNKEEFNRIDSDLEYCSNYSGILNKSKKKNNNNKIFLNAFR